jgi:hypothetical protein
MLATTIARRVFVRPELDEPCPDWARPLLQLSSDEPGTTGLGVASARVPQETVGALQDLCPAPPKPLRERKREGTERRYKPYVKAWPAAVYFALLPFALARQVSLFSPAGGEAPADVAVLCFRRLSDLASQLGLSYDRLQRWMTVLIALGFVKRFRDGRQVLYVLPMTAYIPTPSPEAVLKKLNGLIASQYLEETLPDGRIVWRDRCPEWTAQLIEIRTRFVLRYQLSAALLEGEQPAGHAFQALLHEVSEVIPQAVRADVMGRLFPILARSYLEAGAQQSLAASGGRPLHGELPGNALRHERGAATDRSPNLDSTATDHRTARGKRVFESTFDGQNLQLAAGAADGQSRFNAGIPGQISGSSSLRAGLSADARRGANVDSVAGAPLTLRYNNNLSNKSLEEKGNVNVRDDQSGLRAENRKKAELLADLLRVPGNVNFYTKLFNRVSRGELGEDLIKAAYIYTLLQERAGDITSQEPDALGKYFHGVFRRWEPQRTYDAACQAYRKKWQSKTPQGIRPRDVAVIQPFMPFGFEQIADMIRSGVRAEEVGWLPLSQPIEVPAQPMDEAQAEALAQVIGEQASWYLQEPSCRLVTASDAEFHVVDALLDGQRCTFRSLAEWQIFHEQMLTPPPGLDSLAGAEGAPQDGEEQAGQGTREVECARAAGGLFAYFNQRPVGVLGNLDWVLLASFLSFEELVKMGEPIRFPQVRRGQAQEPDRAPVACEGLNVEIAEGVVLTYEQFQVRLSAGGYHGECVALEDGGFIPRARYEELLATGEYVELDDGTPVSAFEFQALTERVRLELAREEAAGSQVEVLAVEQRLLGELDHVAAAIAPVGEEPPRPAGLPFWWEELSLKLAESDGALLDTEAARRYRLLLQEALDPRLYRLLARPVRTADALCFVLELISLCSGWVLTLEKADQVEQLLDLFGGQSGAEEEGQESERQ